MAKLFHIPQRHVLIPPETDQEFPRMQKVRNRLVNFRVTEEEFDRLKSACDRQGARCLADFVRNMMLSSPDLDSESVVTKIITLDRRVAALETRCPACIIRWAGPADSPRPKLEEVPPCV